MKRADVVVGETYKTKVGNHLAKVLVLGETTSPETNWSKARHFFTVRNIESGRELRRPAAALRAIVGPAIIATIIATISACVGTVEEQEGAGGGDAGASKMAVKCHAGICIPGIETSLDASSEVGQ